MLEFAPFTTSSWTPLDSEFLVVLVVCLVWNFFCFGFVSRRMCPNFWFARGLAEFGQSTGTFWMGKSS